MKAVILAAGYGTRFLPVTRVVPKELLPLVDRPCIDLVVEELAGAGVTELLVISSRRKKALEDWFDRDPELEAAFEAEQAWAKLERARPPAGMSVQFVRQQRMQGTGQALLLAREFAGDQPIIMAYPDDLFSGPNPTAQLIDVYQKTGHSVLSAVDLGPAADVSRYGVLDVDTSGDQLLVEQIVEKPPRGTEPSTLVSMGRYLYTPEVFPLLAQGLAEHGDGEYFPMDAINALAARGRVSAAVLQATRYDTGSPLGYLQTVVEHALAHPEIGPEMRAWLRERLDA